MKLVFLGTRGNTEISSPRHRRHSSALVSYRRHAVMIDCGADWREEVWRLRPPATVLTHAHPDHAWGLRDGAPCPVYATADTWREIAHFGIAERRILQPRVPMAIQGMTWEAFPVAHSILAPAVGFRITAGAVTVFYAPDLAAITDQQAALTGAMLYVGDGATLTRALVRHRDETIIGHAAIPTQLDWCRQEGVPRAVFTHCGSPIIRDETPPPSGGRLGRGEAEIAARVQALAAERGLRAEIAYDGMVLVLR